MKRKTEAEKTKKMVRKNVTAVSFFLHTWICVTWLNFRRKVPHVLEHTWFDLYHLHRLAEELFNSIKIPDKLRLQVDYFNISIVNSTWCNCLLCRFSHAMPFGFLVFLLEQLIYDLKYILMRIHTIAWDAGKNNTRTNEIKQNPI